MRCGSLGEVGEEVDVEWRSCLAAGDRAEEAQMQKTFRLEFWRVVAENREDAGGVHLVGCISSFAKPSAVWICRVGEAAVTYVSEAKHREFTGDLTYTSWERLGYPPRARPDETALFQIAPARLLSCFQEV